METHNKEEYQYIGPLAELCEYLDIPPPKTWREATIKAADKIHTLLELEIERIQDEKGELCLAISLVTVLALLVSEEFDALLKADIEGDWSGIEPLYKQYASQWAIACPLTIAIQKEDPEFYDEINERGDCNFLTWEEWRDSEIFRQCISFRSVFKGLERAIARVPVKEFSPHEKHSGRILLSIDPYCGINKVLESVEKHLRALRDEYHQEIEIDWANELSQGVIDADFIQQEKIEASVFLGDKQAFKGKKQARAPHTTLEQWQYSLRVFDMYRRGYSWKNIVKQSWWTGRTDENASKYDIPAAREVAKKLISFALTGKPLIKSILPG